MRFMALGGIAVLLSLGACVSTDLSQDQAKELTAACRAETGAQGSYSVRMGRGGVPEADPVVGAYGLQDGTPAEAAGLNACIARKTSLPTVAGIQQSRTAVTTGTRTTETFTYGTPPATDRTTAAPSVGGQCARRGGVLQGGSGYC
jgi:hypothetical protein